MTGTSGRGEPSAAWLTGQRWFGAADRAVGSVEVEHREEVAPGVDWLVVGVHFEDGGPAAALQLFWDGEQDVASHPEVVRWLFGGEAPGPVRLDGSAPVRALPGEQSNTSLVVGDEVIVKVFRRLSAERNPDVEAVRGLWDAGFHAVPEPFAEAARPLEVAAFGADGQGRATVDLAVARRFLPGSTDGWELATADVASFPPLAAELGTVTAEMHLALARAFGTAQGEPGGWAATMETQLTRTTGLDEEPRIRERYEALRALPSTGPAVRTHGDYHLGQVIRNGDRWFVLDFEGEPARPVPERIAPTSPLKDVAGMLRSFSYAAAVGEAPEGWEANVRERFLAGYWGTPGIDGLVPPEERDLVLACFELDKAVYEVAYERAHRPSWVDLPIGAVRRLLNS